MEKIQQKNWGKSKKFVSGYFKTKKKRKKVPWTTKPLGGGGKTLVVRPLFVMSSLNTRMHMTEKT